MTFLVFFVLQNKNGNDIGNENVYFLFLFFLNDYANIGSK